MSTAAQGHTIVTSTLGGQRYCATCGHGGCEDEPTVILTDDEHADAVQSYLATALWSSNDDDADPEGYGHPLDDDHDTDDVSDELRREAEGDVTAFVELAGPADVAAYLAHVRDDGQLGHDLWLTRNHHGAGFWDRGLGALGDRLTDWAHSLGEVHLYVGDDGLIYGE